jgi:hypothetical protein
MLCIKLEINQGYTKMQVNQSSRFAKKLFVEGSRKKRKCELLSTVHQMAQDQSRSQPSAWYRSDQAWDSVSRV